MEEEIAVMYPGAGLCRSGLNTSIQQQIVIMIPRAEPRHPEVFPACILQMELLRGGVLTPMEGDADWAYHVFDSYDRPAAKKLKEGRGGSMFTASQWFYQPR